MIAVSVILTALVLIIVLLIVKVADLSLRCDRLEKLADENANEIRSAYRVQKEINMRIDKLTYKP